MMTLIDQINEATSPAPSFDKPPYAPFSSVAELKIFAIRAGPPQPVDRNIGASFRGAVLPVAAPRRWPDRRGYHLIVNRGARLSSRAAVGSSRVGLPPDARCGIHDDVVDTLGLGEHGHMARRHFRDLRLHAGSQKALQFRLNRPVIGTDNVRSRLMLPRRAGDRLIK